MLSVVNYHYIRESFDTKYPSIFGMTNSQFKKQLVLLKGQGDFLNISDFNNNYESILASKDNFYLITFDDGLKEQYINGYSILQEQNLEGYFFLNAVNFKNKKVTAVHKIHLLRSVIEPKKLLEVIYKNVKLNLSKKEKDRSNKIYRFDDKASAMRILILVPDGVGVRNYLYSSFTSNMINAGNEVLIYHKLSESAIQEIKKVSQK